MCGAFSDKWLDVSQRCGKQAEGLEARFARHKKTNQMTRDWAAGHGFTLFPDAGYESVTLTCVNNGAKPGSSSGV